MDECHVLLKKEKMPSPLEWAKAIQEEGFGLELDTSFDPNQESIFGYRPCFFYGKEVGFELTYTSREEDPEWFEEWEDYVENSSNFDFCVSFGIRDDGESIQVAGAVLAKYTDGVYLDVDVPMSITDAMKAAIEADKQMKKEADKTA